MKKRKILMNIIIMIIIVLVIVVGGIILYSSYNSLLGKKVQKNKGKDISYKTEATYEIISNNETKHNILIIIKNELGLQRITYPDGRILKVNNKTKISIDFEVENNKQYEFMIQTRENEEKFILDTNEINNIEILQTKSDEYPIVTLDGVKIGKNVTIEYNQEENRYYSLDNGNTWKEYNDEIIEINENGIIKAKAIKDNRIIQIVSQDIAIELADDAIMPEAYDEDDETNMIIHAGYNNCVPGMNYKYMLVDESINGLELRIKWYCWGYNGYVSYIDFLDKNETSLKQISVSGGKTVDENYVIPEGTVKLKYTMGLSDPGWDINSRIYTIDVVKEPAFLQTDNIYPLMTENGVELFDDIAIGYYPTSINKLWKINDGEWQEYNGETIKVKFGENIYAKGIDKDGNETKISTYTPEFATDAIMPEAYDEDDETNMIIHAGYNNCVPGMNYKYMLVDESINDLELRIKWYCWGYNGYVSYIDFLDKNEISLKQISVSGGKTVDENNVIPEGTVKLKYTMGLSDPGWAINSRIYTIQLVK